MQDFKAMLKMTKVYVLLHEYQRPTGEWDRKELGVYSIRHKAELYWQNAKDLRGFCDYLDAFKIEEFIIDKDLWKDGLDT